MFCSFHPLNLFHLLDRDNSTLNDKIYSYEICQRFVELGSQCKYYIGSLCTSESEVVIAINLRYSEGTELYIMTSKFYFTESLHLHNNGRESWLAET